METVQRKVLPAGARSIAGRTVWTLATAAVVVLGPACGGRSQEPVPQSQTRRIPTLYAANRFVALPVALSGDTLKLFTDTGGGLFLYKAVTARYRLAVDSAGRVRLPAFRDGLGVPEPLGSEKGLLFTLDEAQRGFRDWDGMLGQQWFADRVWTFDYPGKQLLLWSDPAAHTVADGGHTVMLGFKHNADGRRALSFPRIRVEIDGDSLDLLFDTGATVVLPPPALALLADRGEAERATSFITSSTMARWRVRHPDWKVIPNADENVPNMSMIEVAAISVAGYTVGPVWFTERPDRNFHEYMSQFMDQRVEGALGGSALQYFRVTVDYSKATATFVRS